MSTARDLINGSLRLLGVLANGETAQAQEMTDGFLALNEMIDSWSTESLMVFAETRESFLFVGGQQTYTMGVGGNFNTSRPQKITNAAVQVIGTSPPNEIPIEIINEDQWAGIQVKSITSSIPTRLYMDGANPLQNLSYWPIPNIAYNAILYSWKPLSAIADVNTTIVFPPGYAKALRFNLAVTLGPEYGREPNQIVIAGANDSKANIERMNVTTQLMATDPALAAQAKTFNWITGD